MGVFSVTREVTWAAVLMLSASTVFGQVKAQVGVRPSKPTVDPALRNNPKPQPAADQPTVVTVWALAYSTSSDGKHYGSCSPVRITAGGPGNSEVRIGFFESEVGASGNQWRAAGWTAAVTAAQLTDFDPRSMQISFDYEGRVDGPSAGGLMTIGVLAAVRGDHIREDAAMTGTINPDGTIGPVGGIPYKLEGAAKQGKKLVLIPAGLRYEETEDGKTVDLIARGKELGLEVRQVVDIFTAYKMMTGVDLPRPPRGDVPSLSSVIEGATQKRTSVWLNRLGAAIKEYQKLPAASQNDRSLALFNRANGLLTHVSRLLQEGEITAAYWDTIEGTALAYIAMELGRCVETARVRGRSGMVRRIRDNDWVQKEVDRLAKRMREEEPKTLEQLGVYLLACDSFFEALAAQALAKATLANIPNDPGEEYDDLVISSSTRQILAWLDLQLTEDLLDCMSLVHGRPIEDLNPLVSMARFYRRAAQANISVFDSLIVEPQAKAADQSLDDARGKIMQADENYALMHGAELAVIPDLEKYFGDGNNYVYANLGSGLFLHPRAAMLISKYYSMRVQTDDEANIVSVPRERTLEDWLTQADDQARRSISQLESHGLDVSLCTQMYQIANVRRHRSLEDKFHAMTSFLISHLHAQTLRHLAGIPLAEAGQ
jgi:hypothetical protein